ncbi:MAG: hypothetical protein EXX96DRAFT_630377 [Benjaminiella poitrasii]|nr:MAG: hypothetical protein EXX96DRAFT_630377 [Benjaminiella poitrasii]
MRSKRRQAQLYQSGTTAPNRVPTWTVRGTKRTLTRTTAEASSSVSKRSRIDEDIKQKALEALDAEIIEKLTREIQTSINSNKDLENLKDLINGREKLSKNTKKDAAYKARVSYRDMDRVADSLKKTEKTIDRYHRIVNESFYEIANKLRVVAEAVVESQQVEFQQAESAEHAETPMDEDEQGITEREAEGLNITEDKQITTITWSLNKLLGAYLESDIRQAFKDTCRQTMVSLSNYINEYSFLLYRLITSLRTSTFTRLSDGSVDLQQRTDINVERILPEGFQNTTAIRAFLPPIVRQCLEAEGADQQFSKLFDDSELRILHTLYFGSRESEAIASHPFLSALTSDIREENDWQEMIEPFLMRLALAQYMINFKNIWSNKKLFGTMLTRAITVLLRAYLAP